MTLRTALRVGLIAGPILVVAAGFLYVTQRERLLARMAPTLETALADRLGTPARVGRGGARTGGAAPGARGGAPKVLVRRIEIRNAAIAYRSPSGAVTIEDADALLLPDVLMGRVVAEAAAPRGAFEVGGRAIPFDAVRIRAEWEDGRLTVTSASLDGRGLSATANGRLSFVEPTGLDLTATASIDLQAIGPAVPAAQSLSGRLVLEARMKGPFADPAVDGRLDAREGGYDGVPIRTPSGPPPLAHRRPPGGP